MNCKLTLMFQYCAAKATVRANFWSSSIRRLRMSSVTSNNNNMKVKLTNILEEHVMSQKGQRRYRLMQFQTDTLFESGEKLKGGDSICINEQNNHDLDNLIRFLTPYEISYIDDKISKMDCTQVHPSVWNYIVSNEQKSALVTQKIPFLHKIPKFQPQSSIKAMRNELHNTLTEAELTVLSNIGLYDILTELFEDDDTTRTQKNAKTIERILDLQSLLPIKQSAYTIAQCDERSFTVMISEQPKATLRPSIGVRKGTDVVVHPRNSRGWYRLNIGDSITLTTRSKKKLSGLPKTKPKNILICVTGVGAVVLFDLIERYQELVSDQQQSNIIVRIGVNSDFGNVITNRLDELRRKNGIDIKVILSSQNGRLVDYLNKKESNLLEECVSSEGFTVVTCGHPDMDMELMYLLESKGFNVNEDNYRSGTSNRKKRLLYTV